VSHARTPRMRKVNELIREVVADELVELKDPRIGFVTITGVDTAADLRYATVFYSVLGTDEEAKATALALDAAAPHVQRAVATQTRLKFTPKLVFRIDPSIDQGLRIDRLLHEISSEEGTDGKVEHD